MKLFSRKTLGLAILASAALIPGLVYASTAANTTITNTVTVNFANAANTAQTAVTSSVSFFVNLVPASPTLVAGADIDPTTEATANTLTFTITSNANGPDTYDLADNITDTNINAANPVSFPADVTLGATTAAITIAGDNTSAVITVPFDGDDADSSVNGIEAFDTIILDGDEYIVVSVDESTGTTTNLVTITLDRNVVSSVPTTAGMIIPERQTFDVDLTTGTTITAGEALGTHKVEMTATSVTSAAATATDDATIYVRKPFLTVTKYVRNATPASTFNAAGTGTTSIGGVDYFTGGITGNPGDTMEYVIVVDNTKAGAGVAKNIIVSDPIPMFTTLVASKVYLLPASSAALAGITIPASALDVTANNDAAEYVGLTDTLYIYAGTGGVDSSVTAVGGVLVQGERSVVRFQVTID